MSKLKLGLPPGSLMLLVAAMSTAHAARAAGAELTAETLKAWTAYIQVTEQRIAEELGSDEGFLVQDFQSASKAAADRRAVRAGELVIRKMRSVDRDGRTIRVPAGKIHHWRGSVFIPGITLEDVLSRVRNPTPHDSSQEDVMQSRVLERRAGSTKVYLKLKRSKLVTVVYNTEHVIRYRYYGHTRAVSSSTATKIAELEHPDSPNEREKPEGRDRGFLWRLNSYWRYEQVDEGVIVECESVSLSRSAPAVLKYFIKPLINSVARGSMERTLGSMRDRLSSLGDRIDLTGSASSVS